MIAQKNSNAEVTRGGYTTIGKTDMSAIMEFLQSTFSPLVFVFTASNLAVMGLQTKMPEVIMANRKEIRDETTVAKDSKALKGVYPGQAIRLPVAHMD